MKLTTVIGLVLIILGIAALVYPRVSYTKREKVLDLGPLQATAETRESFPISPIVGILAIVGGVTVLVTGNRRTA